MKLLFFDPQGEIAETVLTGLPELHQPRHPSWRGIHVEPEDEMLLGPLEDRNKYWVLELDHPDQKTEPLLYGRVRFDNSWHGIHRKHEIAVKVWGGSHPECGCGACAHGFSSHVEGNLEAELTIPATTFTLEWNYPEPLKWWVNVAPVFGPEEGRYQDSLNFTPGLPGRPRLWVPHPPRGCYVEPIFIHVIDGQGLWADRLRGE